MKVKLLSDFARVPEYAHDGDSGMDLYVANQDKDPLYPGETRTYWTDIAIQLEPGLEAQVRPRSSWSNKGVQVLFYGFVPQLGSVDNPFRGNIGVTVHNSTRELIPIPRGTKIAQLVIAPVTRVAVQVVDELDTTSRGAGGFGSTGGAP